MVGTYDLTNKKNKFYNSTVQVISRRGGYCVAKVGALCSCFYDIGSPVKTQVKNGHNKLFVFRVETIDVSDQTVFTLKDSCIRYE